MDPLKHCKVQKASGEALVLYYAAEGLSQGQMLAALQ